MFKNMLLLVVSLTIAFITAEISLRIFYPQLSWRMYSDYALGWASKEYHQFNPALEPPQANNRRILFLGDSHLAGSALKSLNSRFPIIYNTEFDQDARIKILASGGWGTDQQYLGFLQKGLSWKPTMVVVAFSSNNDISNITSDRHLNRHWPYKPFYVIGDQGELRLYDTNGQPSTELEIIKQMNQHHSYRSYTVDLFRYLVLTLSNQKAKESQTLRQGVDPRYQQLIVDHADWQSDKMAELVSLKKDLSWSPQTGINHISAFIHEDFKTNSYQWRLLEIILKKITDQANTIGARTVLMVLPTPLTTENLRLVPGGDFEFRFNTPDGPFTFHSNEPHKRLKQIAKRIGIEFFDPTPEFIRYVRANNLREVVWPYPEDKHFAEMGHQILAKQFAQYLGYVAQRR